MKKLISLMLVLAMCVLAFASCGECDHDYDDGVCTKCGDERDDSDDCDEHVDEDGDYKCDECGAELVKPDGDPDPTPDPDPNPDPDAPVTSDVVTEAKWRAAFNYTNVTMTCVETVDGLGEETTKLYVYEGEWYIDYLGSLMSLDDLGVLAEAVVRSVVYTDDFAKFRYEDGAYVCDSITLTNDVQTTTMTDIKIIIVDGKVISISYSDVTEAMGETLSGTSVISFTDYGTTVLPESGNVGSGIYSAHGIAFNYPSDFEFDGSMSYVSGFNNFNVMNLQLDSYSMSIYDNMDTATFEELLVPAFESQLGVQIDDYDVFRQTNSNGISLLVLEFVYDISGVDVYQSQILVRTSNSTYVQITCTVVNGVNDLAFIEEIFDSIRFSSGTMA